MKKYLFLLPVFLIFCLVSAQAESANHIVISEIQIGGATGFSTDEFVELYNPLDTAVDLGGWQLIKRTASGAAYPLLENFEAIQIPAHGYFLIAHPTGYRGSVAPDTRYSTNNSISADNSVELANSQGIVDLVGWGKASNFEFAAAIPPGPAKSLERKALPGSTAESMQDGGADVFRGNGEDMDNNANDWVVRNLPEPQSANSELEFITAPAPPAADQNLNQNSNQNSNQNFNQNLNAPIANLYAGPKSVLISEIFPNPKGDDAKSEFIELFNFGETAVNLKDWKLEDTSKGAYVLPEIALASNGWLVIKRSDSGIALNNSGGETVNLITPDGAIVASAHYPESAPENQTYALIDKTWVWSGKPTPGAENSFLDPNQAPVAIIKELETNFKIREEIKFSAADSYDPNKDDLDFQWDFGDGHKAEGEKVTHKFLKPGKFTITLLVKDSKNKTGEKKIFVQVSDYQKSQAVTISSLLPNPSNEETEWLEFFNADKQAVDLTGWALRSGNRVLNLTERIPSQAILRLTETDLNFALKNSGGLIELLDPDGKIISRANYPAAKPGQILSRNSSGDFLPRGSLEITAALNNNVNTASGQVAGAVTQKTDSASTPEKINLSGENQNSLPWWTWVIIVGVLGLAWLGYELWRRRQKADAA
ncbi:PKD domain-containing protein [Candidatus Parcubacteria bacterium]|jgi:hypothetical protein|nr:MAG: PKD domain-containing protein [Candidatus Parcubacteria bacterium]